MATTASGPKDDPSKPSSDVSCYYCAKFHKIAFCPKFRVLTYEDRHKLSKEKRLCFKCLTANHCVKDRKSKEWCSVSGCAGTLHHTLLHKPLYVNSKRPESNFPNVQLSSSVTDRKLPVFLNVVPVIVQYLDKEVEVYAFLDQGSSTCFCDQSLVKELQATGQHRDLTLKTLSSTKSLVQVLLISLY